MKPTIKYDAVNHSIKIDEKVIPISNEAYKSDNLLEKIKIISADLGLRLAPLERGVIFTFISIRVNELIAMTIAKHNAAKILKSHKGEKLN